MALKQVPKFGKRHYELFAKEIAAIDNKGMKLALRGWTAGIFAADNPNFKILKYHDACEEIPDNE